MFQITNKSKLMLTLLLKALIHLHSHITDCYSELTPFTVLAYPYWVGFHNTHDKATPIDQHVQQC